MVVPANTRRGKGWIGAVIEHALGANAGSLSEPDFRLISVELKTIPVGANLRPLESTYVCTVPLAGEAAPGWRESNVRRKLARVLWMPFEGDRAIPLSARRIGAPRLWSPSPDEETALSSDWEALMDRVVLGRVEEISAREGECLQIRPKAANAAARRLAIGASGAREPTLPRGFGVDPISWTPDPLGRRDPPSDQTTCFPCIDMRYIARHDSKLSLQGYGAACQWLSSEAFCRLRTSRSAQARPTGCRRDA